MQRYPDILKIPRGAPIAAIWAFVKAHSLPLWLIFYAGYQVFRQGFHEYVWVEYLLVFACIYFALHMVSEVRIFVAALNADTPYLKMDRTGICWSLPTERSELWSDIEACASRNERDRTILQLVPNSPFRTPVDIDFALAANPKESLDQALVACAAWIAATRERSTTESPIREFVEMRPRKSWTSRAPMILLVCFLIVCVITLIALRRH